ncbi:hypothetical protein RchiOBHm_Chr3g0483551 [Rosa chinensis]|uniref:Uncharacterized protein n=1 Tax=Rosa chinensis TaxID=74649 RepID=A0A2P6REH4_ROSCH|nr:hypothetical protein RchiOBHm_Chr3g0483551 [Rosa chinensis]
MPPKPVLLIAAASFFEPELGRHVGFGFRSLIITNWSRCLIINSQMWPCGRIGRIHVLYTSLLLW